jgi:GNAT superfamily N-acetyltransferase
MNGPAVEATKAVSIRLATERDIPAIAGLIPESARALLRSWYSEAQLEAAIGTAFGVDHSLIEDGTYFVGESTGQIVGCGGWGLRARVFGASGADDGPIRELDPKTEPARIRAFFIHPSWARRGIGRLILTRCEDEARARGFRAVTLMATLGGVDFYRRAGYEEEDPVRHDLGRGMTIDFVRMGKSLA